MTLWPLGSHERVFPVRRISLFLWGARMFFLGLFCAKSSHFGQAKYLLCTKMGLFVQANILLRTKLGRFRQANILLRTKLGLFAQAIFSPHIFVLFFSHFLQFELWWKQILVLIILSDAQFIEYYTYCSPRVGMCPRVICVPKYTKPVYLCSQIYLLKSGIFILKKIYYLFLQIYYDVLWIYQWR